MADNARISVEQAAKIMGLTPAYIRYYMRRGELPIGKAQKARSGKSYRYEIYKPLVEKYIGIAGQKGGQANGEINTAAPGGGGGDHGGLQVYDG